MSRARVLWPAEANLEAKTEQARGDAKVCLESPRSPLARSMEGSVRLKMYRSFTTSTVTTTVRQLGVQIQFPLFDEVRKASARQSAADAARAALDLKNLRGAEDEDRRRLKRAAGELAIKSQLAELDYGIAQDELQSVLIQLHASTGSAPVTPKEEQNARIEEREKYLALLDAKQEAVKAEVTFLRQSGQLEGWLQSFSVSPGSSIQEDHATSTR